MPTETKMTDTGRQSSLTSFFFRKQKERDDGDKENQPENMNRTSSGSLSLQKDTSVPFVKNTTKDQKMVQMYGLSRINDGFNTWTG